MEEFVAYIIKNLVSNPEEVDIRSVDVDGNLQIEVRVAADDVGKVIGKRGRTINSLRQIVRTVMTRLGKKGQLELIQEEGQRPPKQEEASADEEVPEERPTKLMEEVASDEKPMTLVEEEAVREEVATACEAETCGCVEEEAEEPVNVG